MMKIIHTNSAVCGEQGPNLYWRGMLKEFAQLNQILLNYIMSDQQTLSISRVLDNSIFYGIEDFVLFKSETSENLIKMDSNLAKSKLSIDEWRTILNFTKLLSNKPGTMFIEFDSLNLIEEANWIMESIPSSAEF